MGANSLEKAIRAQVGKYFGYYALSHLIDCVDYSEEDIENVVLNMRDNGIDVENEEVRAYLQCHPAFTKEEN